MLIYTKKSRSAFSLIELMIVVAIIGILAAIAVPSYQSYTIRAKMSDANAAIAPTKLAIEEYTSTNGVLPAATAIHLPAFAATQYVSNVVWDGTAITVTTQNTGADGNTITWTPSKTTSGVNWVCVSADISSQYLSSPCTGK